MECIAPISKASTSISKSDTDTHTILTRPYRGLGSSPAGFGLLTHPRFHWWVPVPTLSIVFLLPRFSAWRSCSIILYGPTGFEEKECKMTCVTSMLPYSLILRGAPVRGLILLDLDSLSNRIRWNTTILAASTATQSEQLLSTYFPSLQVWAAPPSSKSQEHFLCHSLFS